MTKTLGFKLRSGRTIRMRVERAGAPSGLGYGRGWLASTDDGDPLTAVGSWFPTWIEAMEFAVGGPLVSEVTA